MSLKPCPLETFAKNHGSPHLKKAVNKCPNRHTQEELFSGKELSKAFSRACAKLDSVTQLAPSDIIRELRSLRAEKSGSGKGE